MKTLTNITLITPDNKPMVDASTGNELNTANLITICLGQSKYASVADQWKAYEITKKLESGKDVELEEAEYELVKKKVEEFEPYRNGFTFMPFLELFK
ncbi:MAG: hypothetical protein IPO40_24390 [Fibrobacteres bacterium]|nr:hypothetical protein [Fibrobacterota bacterium]